MKKSVEECSEAGTASPSSPLNKSEESPTDTKPAQDEVAPSPPQTPIES